MNQIIYVYRVAPIDDFHLWVSPSTIFNETGTDDFRLLDEFNEVFDVGKIAARFLGWEGDMREGPYVSMLPSHDSGSSSPFLIAWKQDNNGDCFIISPYLLPWIAVLGSETIRCNVVCKPEEWQLLMKLVKFEA